MTRRGLAGALAVLGLLALVGSWLASLAGLLDPPVRSGLYLIGVAALATAFLLRPRGVR